MSRTRHYLLSTVGSGCRDAITERDAEEAGRAEKERIERKARWGKVGHAASHGGPVAAAARQDLVPHDARTLRAMVWRRGARMQEAWESVGGAQVVRAALESGGSERGGAGEKRAGAVGRPLHVVHIAAEMAPVAKVRWTHGERGSTTERGEEDAGGRVGENHGGRRVSG
ncbi:unnamed protein product [Closterium sp. Naga37s-1]|nr:unnamed protein product [Closterium sp. Naga37s-1]